MKAFLVIGPESSGTRLVTKIFLHMGCFGDAGHVQHLDSLIFPEDRNIVFRRSLPHASVFPDLDRIYNLISQTHDTRVVVTMRSLYPMIRSQINACHVADKNHATRNISLAMYTIARFLYFTSPQFYIVTYEDLVLHPDGAIQKLSEFAELPVIDEVENIFDGNSKYYTDS